jgi:hypothetical protein
VSPLTIAVPLYRLAHARAGDKGNRLSIAVFSYSADHYPLLVEQVTVEAVRAQFAHRHPGRVTRHPLPRLHGMNFVLDDVLAGGVNSSLTLDRHGKGLSYLLLEMTVAVPPQVADALAIHS